MQNISVLIVEGDPHLLWTQTELLGGCQAVTTSPRNAEEVIRALRFQLLIIGETVPDATARMLLDFAGKLHPHLKILLLGRRHREWYVGPAAFYTATSIRPCELQDAVAALLACDQTQAAQIANLRKMVS